MGEFLALMWPQGDVAALGRVEALGEVLRADGGWRLGHSSVDLRIWVRGADPSAVRDLGDMVVIGLCLEQGRTQVYSPRAGNPDSGPLAVATRLSRSAWGAYIALIDAPGGRAIFKDPSFQLDCFTWRHDQVRVVTSVSDSLSPGLLPPRMALNWAAIAAWCQDPGSAAAISGLDGVRFLAPGLLVESVGDGERETPIWTPARLAASGRRPAQDAADGLREAVELAVEGLVKPHDRLLGELSGGLDSATVAAALVARGLGDRVGTWLNYYGDRPEGDERAYAQAIADRLELRLECRAKAVTPLIEADFAETSRGLRPSFAAVDPVRDRDTADSLRAARATGLLTGQGGDVVFFQMPTPLIAADRWCETGWRGLKDLGDLARFTRRPAWSLLRTALTAKRAPPAPFRRPGLAPDAAALSPQLSDPWSADAADLPPAKRLQITALFQAQLSLRGSRRGAAAEMLAPLLAQPVVEYCLGLSAWELTEGRRDRALARRAFRNSLPSETIDRRSKGDLTAHYGRVIAASLDVLRPLLLDGVLCSAGLLDRARVEVALTPEQLILRPSNGEILIAASIESWVRWWQTRAPDSAMSPRRS